MVMNEINLMCDRVHGSVIEQVNYDFANGDPKKVGFARRPPVYSTLNFASGANVRSGEAAPQHLATSAMTGLGRLRLTHT